MRHRHTWRTVGHLDGCHLYQTSYACRCGAARVVGHERDIESDPYSAMWMLDQDCARCKDLLAGAKPQSFSRELTG